MRCLLPITLFLCCTSATALAGEADILAVKVHQNTDGTYRFSATVQHADTGWEHYADAFEVISPDGIILGTRILAHPHVHEQPFTRSLSNVKLPPSTDNVIVRARDNLHGTSGQTITVNIQKLNDQPQ